MLYPALPCRPKTEGSRANFMDQRRRMAPGRSSKKNGEAAVISFDRPLSGWRAFVLRWFPEHQIYFRTGDQVRFFRLTTQTQLAGAGVLCVLSLWLITASITFFLSTDLVMSKQRQLAAKEQEIAQMERELESMSSRVTNLRGDVSEFTTRIKQRQQLMAHLVGGRLDAAEELLATLTPAKTASPVDTEVSRVELAAVMNDSVTAPDGVAAMRDVLALEQSQLAFAGQASDAAKARYTERRAMLRKLGLSPERLLGQSTGIGGPLEESAELVSNLEPELRELFVSWNKLDMLEQAMESIPSYTPVKDFRYTSGYGFRYDPFTGTRAMHAGLDLAGKRGEPIYAAAKGIVLRAGTAGAYGQMIEIDHGRGLTTRYGHLSKILVKPGQVITQGQNIGKMGSTGRSSGNHLHFEVRIDGRAVNPWPYLEASQDVLKIQRRAASAGDASVDRS